MSCKPLLAFPVMPVTVGAMAVTFYVILTLMCINDIIAFKFDISINATTWMGRIGIVPASDTGATRTSYTVGLASCRSSVPANQHGDKA